MIENIKISLLHAIMRLEEADRQLDVGTPAAEVQLNLLSAKNELVRLQKELNEHFQGPSRDLNAACTHSSHARGDRHAN